MVSVKEQEEELQKFWEKNDIPKKVLKMNEEGEKFYFLDGPPYATGYIHLGTAWNKILKDSFLRYKRMKGFNVWSQPGYDTHGLPIENKVEKKLGIKSKQEIEELGIEKFNKECKKFATEFLDIMNDQFNNLGVWMDWDNPYLTLNKDYIEGGWHTFKVGYEKGLLYKDKYSVHVCPHCQTAVAYNEVEYNKVTDPSVYVKFPVKNKENTYLLVWTTTPWTLPSNTGIMAKPGANYAYVETRGETLIFAHELVEKVMEKARIDNYDVEKVVLGDDLKDLEYDHPLSDIFPFHKSIKNAWRVVMSDQFVTLEDGTGLVHMAPGHGEEDYKVGKENDLPIISPLKMDATYDENCGKYSGIFVKDADSMIMEDFKEKGLLFTKENVNHDYPFCWRCDSPLIFMAVPQWFFKVTEIRNKLIEENKKVNWIPEWAGKRFHNWLESLGDWPVSRQRYWGIPLPIWECEKCGNTKVVGSSDELPKKLDDLHRPYVDEVVMDCDECDGKMKRIPDVLDVWFDSGLASWASLGYPKNKELFEDWWPNEFNLEGPDQIRGWWNSQMITSVITFDRRPFDNVLFHGFVLDAHGDKMSKSRGNIVAPEEVIEKYGRDVLRYYLLSSAAWNDFYFNWADADNVKKKLNIIRNTFRFVKTYVKKFPKEKPELEKEDKWLLSRLNSAIKKYNENFSNYKNHKSVEALENFVLDDYSRWYIKLIRDRTWPSYEGKDKEAALYTMGVAVDSLTKLLAPICPYLAEKGYQDVIKSMTKGKESIHLEKLPELQEDLIDKKLENDMKVVRNLIESSLSARQKVNLKLRWPVKKMVLVSEDEDIKESVKNLEEIIKKRANVRKVEVVESEPKGDFTAEDFNKGKVFLDLSEDQDLMEERLYRDLTRKIQSMRKKAGLKVIDKIELTLKSEPDFEKILEKFSNELKKDVGAGKVQIGKLEGKDKNELNFREKEIQISF